MMIANTCLVVTLMVLNHGLSCNSHVVSVRQGTDSLKSDTPRISVGEVNDRVELEEGSGIMETMLDVEECPGSFFPTFIIDLPNPSGCYIFQTTGFNMMGYPNNTGPVFLPQYNCDYDIQFGATVSGTVTVKEKDFQFQEPDGDDDCSDYLLISGVNDQQQQIDNTDSDDRNSDDNEVQYCGTIPEDKTRAFSASEISIRLAAGRTVNGNGAEIVICID